MNTSIVILYYNRFKELHRLLSHLCELDSKTTDICIIDNASHIHAGTEVLNDNLTYVRLDSNEGAVARNRGFDIAAGDIIVCLDDDVYGVSNRDIDILKKLFENSEIAAVCFKVIDPINNKVTNWSHHYDVTKYSDSYFETNRISEGAVAFRSSILKEVGGYCEKFFISHEGPDLACRIMNIGKSIIYCPEIVVEHHHSMIGRTSWRRYYFDTRNIIWLCARNYPLGFAIEKLVIGILPMLIYSLRDGYLKYWWKGVYDGFKALPDVINERQVISNEVLEKTKLIESHRPNFCKLSKIRLFRKGVRI